MNEERRGSERRCTTRRGSIPRENAFGTLDIYIAASEGSKISDKHERIAALFSSPLCETADLAALISVDSILVLVNGWCG